MTFIDDAPGREWRRALRYPNSALTITDYEPPATDLLSQDAGCPADAGAHSPVPVSAGFVNASNDPCGDNAEGDRLASSVFPFHEEETR
jgi:hypothetical protein